MALNLTFLGHASFLFETENVALVSDPWFSQKGAFLGTWRQFPPISSQLEYVKSISNRKPLYIFLSHEHQDHFDKETIKKLNPHIHQFIVVKYNNKVFIDDLRSITDKNIIEYNEKEFFKIVDLNICLFKEESGINRDSAILISDNNQTILNYNDCKMFDQSNFLKELVNKIDIVTGQFSGAVMHPHSYKYSSSEEEIIVNRKKRRKFIAVSNFIKELKPRCYIPSAGPPILLSDRLENLNYRNNTCFPKNFEFYSWWKNKKALNDVHFYEMEYLKKMEVEKIGHISMCKEVSDKQMTDYINFHKKNLSVEPELSEDQIISFLNESFREKLDILKNYDKAYFPKMNISFIIEELSGITIDFQALTVRPRKNSKTDDCYTHYTTKKLLTKMIMNNETWETYFLSMDFLNKRFPDEFDTIVNLFLVSHNGKMFKYGLDLIKSFRNSEEFVTLTSKDGSQIECSKYCPHQGASMENADYDGRYIICPRHGWKFDTLNEGKEIENSTIIKIK